MGKALEDDAGGGPPWPELARGLRGEVDASSLARRLHSQDASIYQEAPLAVARPKDAGDVAAIAAFAARHGVPLIPRAGGTSLAGQCVGRGLVVDVSRHMTRIVRLDPDARLAVVEPGVIQDDLNDAAAPHGLHFAPDTSTSKQAAIGGMIGNNSAGSYSILHGSTRDHLLAVEAVLADGSRATFQAVDDPRAVDGPGEPPAAGRLRRALAGLVDRHRDAILADYPKPSVRRRNMGYALDWLANTRPWNPAGPPFNLAPFLCGSEGTLALVTSATLRLAPRPAARRLVCAHFESVDAACRATAAILERAPAAVELIDGVILEAVKDNREQARNRAWVQGAPAAVLAVEFFGRDDAEAQERAAALAAAMAAAGPGYAHPVLAGADVARVWAIRKAGLALLSGIPGDAKPVTAIEDIAVAPEDLAAFVSEMESLMRRHGCRCVYYGHASVGLLHYRPVLNLKEAAGFETFLRLQEEAVELTRRYRGSLSGEHGDGRLRSPWLPRMFRPEIFARLEEVKRAFDPAGLLNPGVITAARPAATSLRCDPSSRTPAIDTLLDWSRPQGFVRAVEACNGAGFCRQGPGRGAMCPSYMATREEADTTRGRANVLRQLLTSGDPDAAWTHPDLDAVLDTCLSCKACAAECPSNVDLARLKAEVLQKRHDRRGAPLRSAAFGHYALAAKLARAAPGLASWLIDRPAARRALGIAPARRMPPFARRTLAAWFRDHVPHPRAGARGEVALFNDEFTQYGETAAGIAAVEVLEAAGWRVRLPGALDSGRALISKGFLRAARRALDRTVGALRPWAERGVDIVGVEPSALLGLRDEAPDLVSPARRADAAAVKARARLFEEFLAERAAEGRLDLLRLGPPPAPRILFHGHCHQKALAGTAGTLAALRLIPGAEVTEIASGCCGMAGSFGYEKEHHELSMRIGELALFPAIRAAPDALVCAPGLSCRHHIADGTGRDARHPAEVLRRCLAEPGAD
jgi:FAD/FMN-containing dehydrogenase/Fe-S oxidoreductase